MKKTLLLLMLISGFSKSFGGYVSFKWSMTPLFQKSNSLYNKTTHEYSKDVMNFSAGWVVEFTTASGRSIPNPVYVWDIQGLGALSTYHRIYNTTSLPNLSTSKPLSNIKSVQNLNIDNTVKPKFAFKSKRKVPGEPQPPPNQEPLPPTWYKADRLPSLGRYKVTVTVSSANKSNTETYTYTQTITLRNIVIACLGDSYASGEGNPDTDGVAGGTDEIYCANITLVQKYHGEESDFMDLDYPAGWFDIQAHRSFKSGYSLAARQIEDMDPHSTVTFINLSVSGAKIQDGLMQPQPNRPWMRKGQVGYLKELVGDNKIDVLLLSIGGNDIGFANILEFATKEKLDIPTETTYRNAIASLKESYLSLNLYLKDKFKIDHILIAEYPTHLFSNNYSIGRIDTISGQVIDTTITNQFSCELFQEWTGRFSIHYPEILRLNAIGEALQTTRIEAASQFNWLYAGGIADKFKNHGYCSNADQSYWIQASYSCVNQGDTKGTMHPNPKGQAVIRQSILEKLTPVLFPKVNWLDTTQSN